MSTPDALHPPSDASPTPLTGRCATHGERQAVGLCLRCDAALCMECRQVDARRRSHCSACLNVAPEPARALTRLLANAVDQFVAMFAFTAVVILHAANEAVFDSRAAAWLGLLAIAAVFVVQAVLVHRTGQSLGKRLLGIRVVRSDGSPVSLARVLFVRTGPVVLLSYFCSPLGLVDALFIFGQERCCLHDLVADTRVVTAPRALKAR